MLFLSQADVDNYINEVIGHVATQLGVSPNLNAIKAKNPTVGAALEAFIQAYINWYKFHVAIDASMSVRLSNQEHQTLLNRILFRDSTRNDLVNSISNALSISVSSVQFNPTYDEAQQDEILEERLETLFGQK